MFTSSASLGGGVLALAVVLLLSAGMAPLCTLTFTSSSSSTSYEQSVPSWVGGYTVEGTTIAAKVLTSFSVAQECLCAVTATAHGIFAMGANAENAFSMVAALEPDGQWHAQQVSVGADVPYVANMRFGSVAGGAHSAVGHLLQDGQTNFRADQSVIGCDNGIGAAACEGVCLARGLRWAQIAAKCGAAALDGSVLTDWHSAQAQKPAAALFSSTGANITLHASVDGRSFRRLHGFWVPNAAVEGGSGLVVNFAPWGGPYNLAGEWRGDRITWADGNTWRRDAPPCAEAALRAESPDPACWPEWGDAS